MDLSIMQSQILAETFFFFQNCLPSIRQKGDWASLGVFSSILRDSVAIIVSCMFASLMNTKLDVSNLLTWDPKSHSPNPTSLWHGKSASTSQNAGHLSVCWASCRSPEMNLRASLRGTLGTVDLSLHTGLLRKEVQPSEGASVKRAKNVLFRSLGFQFIGLCPTQNSLSPTSLPCIIKI